MNKKFIFLLCFLLIISTVEGSWIRPKTSSFVLPNNVTFENVNITGNLNMGGSILNVTTLNINVTGNIDARGNLSGFNAFFLEDVFARNLFLSGVACDSVGCIPNMSYYYNKTEIDSILNGTEYLPSSLYVRYGTNTSGDVSSLFYPEDGNTLNVTEASGANANEVYVNFTNVTSFNKFEIRYRYDDGGGHIQAFEIYDYVSGTWEGGYLTIEDTLGEYIHIDISVLDYEEHVQNGIVQTRIRHVSLGVPSHVFVLDHLVLKNGLGGGNLKDGTGGWHDDGMITTTMRDVEVQGINNTIKVNGMKLSPVGENYPQRCEEDFITTTTNKGCWICGGITGAVGTQAAGNGEANHPGTINLRSLANTPNSGYFCVASATSYDIEGGEEFRVIFKTFLDTTNSSRATLGWMDIFTAADSADSINFEVNANTTLVTVRGRAQSNNADSYTSNYTLNTNDWYKGVIMIAPNLNNVTFYLYNSSNSWYNDTTYRFESQLLWNESLTTNIPSTSARLVGNGFVVYSTANASLQNMLTIDYMTLDLNRRLLR